MKKFASLMLVAVLALSVMAGCSQKTSGTVTTDGSTSMEKVIGALGEAFMEQNGGVTFTYNPTGSGSGIQAVFGGALRHRPQQPQSEGGRSKVTPQAVLPSRPATVASRLYSLCAVKS